MNVITKNDYEIWKEDGVTKRFMAEMEINLRDTEKERIFGMTELEIVKAAYMRNQALTIFESILEWKPEEIENNE